jgi:hypothetical protein
MHSQRAVLRLALAPNAVRGRRSSQYSRADVHGGRAQGDSIAFRAVAAAVSNGWALAMKTRPNKA